MLVYYELRFFLQLNINVQQFLCELNLRDSGHENEGCNPQFGSG